MSDYPLPSRDVFGAQLGHLRAFLAVYDEHNVRRAAAYLGVTPSAVSHSLTKLREIVGDDLFLRRPDGMVPTVRADEIAAALRPTLDKLYGLLHATHFNPAVSTRSFTIGCLHYLAVLMGPQLACMAAAEAPHISFELRPLQEDILDLLERGRIDFAIAPLSRVPASLHSQPLANEVLAFALRSDHPRGTSPLTLTEVAGLRHVDIRIGTSTGMTAQLAGLTSEGRPSLEAVGATLAEVLAANDLEYEVAMTVPDLSTALAIVAKSDLVALCIRRAAEEFARNNPVQILDLPRMSGRTALADRVPIHLIWNARYDRDSAHLWLRNRICTFFERQDADRV